MPPTLQRSEGGGIVDTSVVGALTYSLSRGAERVREDQLGPA